MYFSLYFWESSPTQVPLWIKRKIPGRVLHLRVATGQTTVLSEYSPSFTWNHSAWKEITTSLICRLRKEIKHLASHSSEYYLNGNQWLWEAWVMCFYTATAKRYPITKKASGVLWRKDWSVQNSATGKDFELNVHIILLILFQRCQICVQELQ